MADTARWGASPQEWAHFSFSLGLTADLLPVVSNPAARVSAASKLKTLGKTPSKYNGAGEVVGIHQWTQKQSLEAEIDAWSRQGDYGLCLQTRAVRGLDIDCDDQSLVNELVGFFVERLSVGALPARVRDGSPRVLLALDIPGGLDKRVLKLKDGAGIVEFLATGQQFVACGTHPSGSRYTWAGGLPTEVPLVSIEHFDAVWTDALALFADLAWLAQHGGRDGVQHHLAGGKGALPGVALQGQHDPVVDWLDAQGWIREVSRGRVFVWCPWRHEHSGDSGVTESEWFRAGTGGFELGHYRCLHAHCTDRGREAFLEEVGFSHALEGEFSAVEDQEHGSEADASTTPPARLDGAGAGLGVGAAVSTRMASVAQWRSMEPGEGLRRTKKGFVASLDNLCRALDTEGFWSRLGYDTFRCEIMRSTWHDGRWGAGSVTGGAGAWVPWTDNDYGRAKRELENAGFEPIGLELVRMAVGLVADERQFDSAQLWLGGLAPWDGVARVETFFSRYMGVADGPYSRACGRYLWSALAGRVLCPGVKADMVPILVGPGGYGKSTGLEAIAPGPEWVVGVDLSKQDAELSRRVRGKTVVVLSELRGLKSKELEAILDWVTLTHDTWTPKYKEYGVQNARRFILTGCCNPRGVGIFDDEAGNRRWLPMTVERRVDVLGVRADREQLWVEGVTLYGLEGVLWQDAERLGKDEHADYEVESQWEGLITAWLDKPRPADFDLLPGRPWSDGGFSLDLALTEACGFDIRQIKPAQTHEIARVLRKHGYDNRRKRFGGGVRVRRWARDNAED